MADDYEIARLPRERARDIFRTGRWTAWRKLHRAIDELAAQTPGNANTSEVLDIAMSDRAHANLAITSLRNYTARNLPGWGHRTRVITDNDQTHLYVMLVKKKDNDND